MKKNKITKQIIDKYFNKNLEIRVQIYNLLSFIGISGGLVIAVICLIIKENLNTVIINLLVSVLAFVLLQIAEKTKRYNLCSWIIVFAIFFVMFPVLFFKCGGYKSGAAYSFMTGIIFTAILLEKYERIIALAFEILLYVSCCLLSYYKPETAVVLSSEFEYVFVTILNFGSSCALLLSVALIRTRIFNGRQIQIQELNRELEARNETLMRYDIMKSDFLATVAHEINTPLAVISASSNDTLDLLKESPLNLDEITENQNVIERRVKMIDNILMDLMDTVAIENGRLSLSRQPVKLPEFIKSICDIQFKRLDLNDNRVIFDCKQDLPEIWIDQTRIEQVMINLLSNAVHYTKSGIITVKIIKDEKGQTVSVTDTGEGMDEETIRVALKQYVSTKADYWRHGIGLYICRRIIMAHDGDIWIESEKGRGTTVYFTLGEGYIYE